MDGRNLTFDARFRPSVVEQARLGTSPLDHPASAPWETLAIA